MNFSCSRCEFSTPYRSNLSRHLMLHKVDDENARKAALTCDWCCRKFANKYNCDRHKNSGCCRNPQSNPQDAPNVNLSAPNVNLDAPNVNLEGGQDAPNVNLRAPNVNIRAPNVNLGGLQMITDESRNKKYPCPTCFRTYSREGILRKHIATCDQTATIFQCSNCYAIFSCRQTKSKHMKNCTLGTLQVAAAAPASTSASVVNNNYTTNNIQNQHIVNNTQIVINGFGKEFTGHLTPEFLAAQALRMNGEGVVKCIEKVHFNPNYPENHNIRLVHNADVPKTAIAVFDNDQWSLRDYYNTMRTLIQHTLFILRDRASQPDFRKQHNDSWSSIYLRLQTLTARDNPADFYAVMREVKLLLQSLDKVTV